MPALPWTAVSQPDPSRDYLVMASRLPLTRYRDIPSSSARRWPSGPSWPALAV